ncbi:Mitotic spindle assembly checkpoint protein MAD2B [Phytophthora cinnamomi]|uniref:Mitotic spindle assembly checkpoint protein MAD2B n=1 Tax=Phytophthora cinnamomi TaxID=4785 RepID=UPI003559EAFA|nr:Mitotic spindle assembly checkpoint protein MAD2B [Phytophthora cinnamomi]
MESDGTKATTSETLTDLVLEFLEAAVHEFLFAWQVYPKESFEQRVLYDVPIHMSRHPLLCEYIHSMLAGCRAWLLRAELEKLCVILLSKEGRTMDTLVVEAAWSAGFMEASGSDEDQPLPLVQLEEAFRAGMVALVATPASRCVDQSEQSKPRTFRILAQTVEDANGQATAINSSNASNSWVLADPFWCEDQKKPKEISPVKTIQSDASPIRLHVYMEKQQAASVAEVGNR